MPNPYEILGQYRHDHKRHPNIESFKTFIRTADSASLHPWLIQKQQEADVLAAQAASIKIPQSVPIDLIPKPVDQGLILTPYDQFEEMRVAIPPEKYIEGFIRSRDFFLKAANHPSRITAMKMLERQGFIPPCGQKGVIDSMLNEKATALQLSDLGQNKDVNGSTVRHYDTSDDFVNAQIANYQVHRTENIATGPFSFVGKRVRSYVGLGAMPDINGSVLALATAAQMHMLAEIPEVGVFSDVKRQLALAKATFEFLDAQSVLLDQLGYNKEQKQSIVNRWKSCIVGVLEVDANKALKRSEELVKVGVSSFRPYGHTTGGDVVKTVQALRKDYPTAEILASQITNVDDALACEYVGADAVIIGVGSGGRCTTADLSQLIPSNAILAWKLRGKLAIPVIGEGGAVDEPVVSALVGMSGVNGSGSIGGGTFEAPGGVLFLTRDGKTFYKPYGGEASDRMKWLSNRTYPTGHSYFPEGKQDFKVLEPLFESMTARIIRHWERLVLGAVTLGVDAGPLMIPQLQNIDPSPLLQKSPTTQYLQRTH